MRPFPPLSSGVARVLVAFLLVAGGVKAPVSGTAARASVESGFEPDEDARTAEEVGAFAAGRRATGSRGGVPSRLVTRTTAPPTGVTAASPISSGSAGPICARLRC